MMVLQHLSVCSRGILVVLDKPVTGQFGACKEEGKNTEKHNIMYLNN
jgi:hypothetical protein